MSEFDDPIYTDDDAARLHAPKQGLHSGSLRDRGEKIVRRSP